MSRIRNFCFTWNNYPVDAESKLTWLPRVKYLVAGREVGESGTPHLQGFVYFSEQKTLSAAIKLLPGCHVEVSKTLDEAIAYCKKDGDYFEVGIPPISQSEKGKKGKEYWEEVKKLACEGTGRRGANTTTLWPLYSSLKRRRRGSNVEGADVQISLRL